MTRVYPGLYIFVALVSIAICLAYDENKLLYRNLYGFERDKTQLNEAILNLSIGALKFMRESERVMNNGLKDTTPAFNQEYDFVVIGAGSAGAAISSRLSEESDVKVLLIEAGRREKLMMDIPLIVNYLQFSDEINWKYQTEPSNDYCLGMTDRKCNYPRGKVMGGSSVLNYMIATRGNSRDYDDWAYKLGNKGWSYNELLKYFKRLENMGIDELRRDKTMHSTRGPLHISYPPYRTPLAESFIEAGLEMGYPTIDYNNEKQSIGFSYIQATLKNGSRHSTNQAYLYPARKRKNLFVTHHSHVNNVLIDPETKIAYGVNFTKSGNNILVRAKKEVILCAGAIGSPQILMLSGVGPSKHLREMGIDAIQDLPVGENLQDHVSYGGIVMLVDQPVSITSDVISNPMKPYLSDYLNKRSGPYTIPGGCEALAFIDVDNPKSLDAYPNMELLFVGGSVVSDTSFRHTFGISDEYWSKMFANLTGRHSWTIFPMLMHPKSRGRLLLRSKDPRTKPKIYANYFEDPEDVRIMIGGIKAAIEVSKTKAMQRFKSEFYEFKVPGCERYEDDSNEYWECAARTFSFTIYHYTGTCKMAPKNDPTGVVNSRLQVKGIKRLRVVDASIMPTAMTGHTNIPTVMIAEKAADMIKEDWNLLSRR